MAPKALQVGRFLPPTPIRILLDKASNNLGENVAFDGFNQQLSAVGRQTASKLAGALQSAIHPMITTAKDMAQEKLEVIRAQSLAKMQTSLSEEQERLSALKQINPNIRQEEITFYDKQRTELTAHIEKAQLQLDAIRLIVVSH
ncbi:ATP-dependent helicase HepA [Pseudoalteromonas sp. BSi20480]|nr:ATP-dependent helicase HepA [Pseudoalteromonas sp. BSi20480]